MRGRSDEDLVGARLCQQASRSVDHVTRQTEDSLTTVAPLRHDQPGVDRGVQTERMPETGTQLGVELAHEAIKLERGGDGAPRIVIVRGRDAEDRLHFVPGELVDGATVR